MALPELDNLLRIGKLKAEPPAASELAGLLHSGIVRLADAQRVLDDAHRKRNIAEYEGDIEVDAALLEALLRVTAELATRVRALLAG